MRFLLAPNFASRLDLKILKNLSNSLEKSGNSCEVSLFPLVPNPNFPADGKSCFERFKKNKKEIYKSLNCDVLIEINRFRSRYLNKKIIHINWIQDLPPCETKKILTNYPKSLQYTYGSPVFFGLERSAISRVKPLLSGYSTKELDTQQKYKYDLNLLGYMSPIWEIARENDGYNWKSYSSSEQASLSALVLKEILRKPRTLIEIFCKPQSLDLSKYFPSVEFKNLLQRIRSIYEPLSGFLDYHAKAEKLKYLHELLWNYLFVEYPRYKDRLILFNKIKILPASIKKIVAGFNWKNYYPEYDFVSDYSDETDVFINSKVTVHNNTHGLGLHPRIYECVSCGSFPLMHGTPHKKEDGSLETALEPGRHFGLYTKDNFTEIAQYWIENNEMRKKGVREAQAIFSEHHTWNMRAGQILEDIKNL